MLRGGELVGVWPEGFKGIGKPYAERYKLQRFGRGGFVAAALRTGVPIVPLSVVGAEEIYPLVGNLPVAGPAARAPLPPDHAAVPAGSARSAWCRCRRSGCWSSASRSAPTSSTPAPPTTRCWSSTSPTRCARRSSQTLYSLLMQRAVRLPLTRADLRSQAGQVACSARSASSPVSPFSRPVTPCHDTGHDLVDRVGHRGEVDGRDGLDALPPCPPAAGCRAAAAAGPAAGVRSVPAGREQAAGVGRGVAGLGRDLDRRLGRVQAAQGLVALAAVLLRLGGARGPGDVGAGQLAAGHVVRRVGERLSDAGHQLAAGRRGSRCRSRGTRWRPGRRSRTTVCAAFSSASWAPPPVGRDDAVREIRSSSPARLGAA